MYVYTTIGSHDERPVMSCDGHTSNVMSIGMYSLGLNILPCFIHTYIHTSIYFWSGFQADQKWLYTGSEDGSVRVWDSRSNACSRKYDCGVPVNTVALHPNQVELISGDQNGNGEHTFEYEVVVVIEEAVLVVASCFKSGCDC